MLGIVGALDRSISLAGFPLDVSIFGVIPICDHILVLDRLVQRLRVYIDEPSPVMILNKGKYTLNQDNLSEFSIRQQPS